jgi:1-deoxy-D-xylulose-5-phosphate reductoisomerase
LIRQALEFEPNAVVIVNDSLYREVYDALSPKGIKVFSGKKSLDSVVQMETVDMVVTAMVGFSGLSPTIAAVNAGKPIALSNKETLVVAGEYITRLAQEKGVNIYPVDSEHSAIFQCLIGEFHNKISRLVLTASGGPFRGFKIQELERVTVKDALNHPNWSMGQKITIDSATLMNKGLEVIEAKWLFGVDADQIDVVIHPQSIIHSMVEFEDGSLKVQLGIPDMRIPIQFALSYPDRLNSNVPRFSFADNPVLDFEKPDLESFRNLAFAYKALETGGNMPCIVNAANEIAVEAFLKEKISFLGISEIIEKCMDTIPVVLRPQLEDYFITDKETRIKALEFIK